MVQRVIIGTRNSEIGMWVSRPGKSVYSTNPADFLIDTTRVPLSPIIAGTITNPVLAADSNNFHSPTVPTSEVSSIVDYVYINNTKTTVYNVNGAKYTSETGYPNADGIALYYKDYWFKQDHTALLSGGKYPLMHISIGDPNVGTANATVGDNYPKVYVYPEKIRLAVYQNWDAVANPAWYYTTSDKAYYPTFKFWYNYAGVDYYTWAGGAAGEVGQAGVKRAYRGPTPPSTLATNCVINYAVYNVEMVLP